MLHNWRYFFRSSLLERMSGEEIVENQEQFVAIMQVWNIEQAALKKKCSVGGWPTIYWPPTDHLPTTKFYQ